MSIECGSEAYSILKRIVASATFVGVARIATRIDLQYPQTDRGLCNIDDLVLFLRVALLTVSSNGSWPLQHR